jgi:hypothetical protein
MTQVNYKGISYDVPESFGKLKAKVAMDLYEAIAKVGRGELSNSSYNFKYVSLVLGIPQVELENEPFDLFIKVLGDINAILASTSNPQPNEVENPAV